MFTKIQVVTKGNPQIGLLSSCCTCGCGCSCKPEDTESSVRTPGARGGAGSASSKSPTAGV